jgi:hypothetical protein
MTALIDRFSPAEGRERGPGPSRRLPRATHSRRPLLAVVSATVVLVSVAAFASLYSSADHQTSAVIVTTTIQQGHPFVSADLGEASVSVSSGVVPIPVADASELVGKRASVTIPAGSLLTPRDVSTATPVGNGLAVVGLALKDGQLPAAGVTPGDPVMIVQTASPGTPLTTVGSGTSTAGSEAVTGVAPGTGILVPTATVFDVETPSSDSSSGTAALVSVEVPSTYAAAVSTAAAAGQVSLVLLPQEDG